MKRTFEVSPWHVKTTKWAPEDKLLQESITALANENLGNSKCSFHFVFG